MTAMEVVLILLIALALDLTLGEPPSAVHPVAWIGKVISFLIKGGKKHSSTVQFLYGMAVVLITVSIFAIPVYLILSYLDSFNFIVYIIVSALLLKTSFSLKGLRQAALRVRNFLAEGKLAEARFEIRALVGRDTSQLDKTQLTSAAVESVAENICDSFFAPLFYFLLFGVVGAIAYRVINTLDSMIGHRGEFEYLGKFAAWLDSLVNFIPARIAALAIILSSWICRAKTRNAWQIMLRDHRKTESLNAGWTMAATAGALGVQLEKVGHYNLGDNHTSLSISSIDASLKLVTKAAFIWSLVLVLIEVVYYATT